MVLGITRMLMRMISWVIEKGKRYDGLVCMLCEYVVELLDYGS